MRRCYIVCYDIADPKRLRLVHRTLKGYGEKWQYSVFFCVLKDIDRVRLEGDLKEIINNSEDQVLIIDYGPDETKARGNVTTLGASLPEQQSMTLII